MPLPHLRIAHVEFALSEDGRLHRRYLGRVAARWEPVTPAEDFDPAVRVQASIRETIEAWRAAADDLGTPLSDA